MGIKARGRTRKLTKNYRNTKEILTAAWTILESTPEEPDVEATFPKVKPEAALRSGKLPCLQICDSSEQEVKGAIEIIQSLQKEGYNSQDIAIAYRSKGKKDQELFSQLINQLKQVGIETYWVTKTDQEKENYNTQKSGVRILTSLSCLGLEFPVIILL